MAIIGRTAPPVNWPKRGVACASRTPLVPASVSAGRSSEHLRAASWCLGPPRADADPARPVLQAVGAT
jgi:hypothetical protein